MINQRFFGVGPIITEPTPMYKEVSKQEQKREDIVYSLPRENLEKALEGLRAYREAVPADLF